MSQKKLIALIGLRQSGKDTAAAALLNEGWKFLKFAEALKGMLRFYLRFVGASEKEIDRMIEGGLKEEPSVLFRGKSPRWAMQTLGTEWGRNLIADDLWVRATLLRAAQLHVAGFNVVIGDCRFPNEAAAIQEAGGRLVKITRPACSVDNHASENQVDELPFDISLSNDGTIDELQTKVLQLISKL